MIKLKCPLLFEAEGTYPKTGEIVVTVAEVGHTLEEDGVVAGELEGLEAVRHRLCAGGALANEGRDEAAPAGTAAHSHSPACVTSPITPTLFCSQTAGYFVPALLKSNDHLHKILYLLFQQSRGLLFLIIFRH